MKGLLLALQFLSIVPVRVRGEVQDADLLRSVPYYPLVGALAGGLMVLTHIACSLVLPSEISAVMSVLVLVIFTGALHLDGLSDTFDAMASKSGLEQRLEIMRDGSAGPVGMVALVFVLGLKVLAIDALWEQDGLYYTLFMAPVFGRWVMSAGMLVGKPSRAEGLGRIFIGRLGTARFAVATALLLLFAYGAAEVTGADMFMFSVLGLVILFLLAAGLSWLFSRRFGGQSGDTLGASGELAEAVFLILGVVWTGLYI